MALVAAGKLGMSGRFSIVEQPDNSATTGTETPTYSEGIRDPAVFFSNLIDNVINEFMNQLAETFPDRTRVIAVTDDYLVLNVGSASLVNEGTVFDIYRPPAVPNAAEEDMEHVGWARVTEVGEFACKAPATTDRGSSIVEGDICICDEDWGMVYE